MQPTKTTTAVVGVAPPAPKVYDGSGDLILVGIAIAACLIPLAFLPRYWTQERIDQHNR